MPATNASFSPPSPQLVCDELPDDGATLCIGNELRLHGWASAPDGPAAVVVEVAGEAMPVTGGLEFPANAATSPAPEEVERAGFEVLVDTSSWERGLHPIRIVARDAIGSETTCEGTVDVMPYQPAATTLEGMANDVAAGLPGLACDEPPASESFTSGRLLIARGWAFARGGLDGVFIAFDGRWRQPAETGLRRRDLVRLIDADAGQAGWQAVLELDDVPEGEHRITVVALARDGQTVGVERAVVVRAGATRPPSPRLGPDGQPDVPERFVPEEFRGELIDAEHQARYRWAAPVARGGDVLDAACGEGYGASILAEAGARRVVGVDRTPEAVLNARERAGDLAEFMLADLRSLPFDDASFDLVTCFEAIEHVTDTDAVLDELRRVLRDGGILLVSTPHRDVYTPGNPHHFHEYTPPEFEAALRSRFATVRLHRQNAHLASFLAGDEASGAQGGGTPVEAEVRKLVAAPAELYTVAAAGNGELPVMRDLVILASVFEVRQLLETSWQWEERAIAAEADATATRSERDIAVLARERTELLVDEVEAARRRAQARLDKIVSSPPWRVAAALRRAARAAGRRLRP